jgi:hypothetical protein
MKKFFFLLLLVLAIPSLVLARVGVGVGTGKIVVDEPFKPGIIYSVPPITVINTGDEPSKYELAIAFHANQPELLPSKEWFSFSPEKFNLESGKIQVVNIRLNLPIKVKPGNYFAYLEAHPVVESKNDGTARINVAAASKFYFSIAPANIFQGFYYRLLSFFSFYAPWTYIVSSLIIVAALLTLFRRKFKFKLNIKIDKK